jgi:hypothetical protein
VAFFIFLKNQNFWYNIDVNIFMADTKNKQFNEFAESSEIWVADFGSHELEQELRQEVIKLKPQAAKGFSWIFAAVILFSIIIIVELLFRQYAQSNFWSEMTILWTTWIWRFVLLIIWFTLVFKKMRYNKEKVVVATLVSFTLAVIALALFKIIFISSAWTWLNLLVEPIWMIILVAFLGFVFTKLIFKK